ALMELAARVLELTQPANPINLQQMASQVGDPLQLAYLLASMLSLELSREQTLLEAPSRIEALRLLHGWMTHEVQALELRHKLASRSQRGMAKNQRDYMRRQQMRAIQDELGEKNPEKAEIDELRQRLDEADLPENVRKEAERELRKLERLPSAAPDFQVTRS